MRIFDVLTFQPEDSGLIGSMEPALFPMIQSSDMLEAKCGEKLQRLIRFLEEKGPDPKAFCFFNEGVLLLTPIQNNHGVRVKLWIDFFDFKPLKQGVPELHFRFQIAQHEKNLSYDARVSTEEEAEQVILKAFSGTTD